MNDTRRIYLVKKGANLKMLPLEGTYDKYIEIPYTDVLLMDDLFITEGVYNNVETLFGPGDCDYLDTDKCKKFIREINRIKIDDRIQNSMSVIMSLILEAIEYETGVFFDF